jgi:hypothetical protein
VKSFAAWASPPCPKNTSEPATVADRSALTREIS